MDDLGDIFYVLIIVISFVGSGIKAILKKSTKDKPEVSPVPSSSEYGMEEVLEEDLYQPSVQTPVNYHELSTYMTDEQIQSEYPQIYQQHIIEVRQREKLAEMQRVRQKSTSSKVKPVLKNDVESDIVCEGCDIDFSDDDQVRKAFIASEIFGRKY